MLVTCTGHVGRSENPRESSSSSKKVVIPGQNGQDNVAVLCIGAGRDLGVISWPATTKMRFPLLWFAFHVLLRRCAARSRYHAGGLQGRRNATEDVRRGRRPRSWHAQLDQGPPPLSSRDATLQRGKTPASLLSVPLSACRVLFFFFTSWPEVSRWPGASRIAPIQAVAPESAAFKDADPALTGALC